MKTPHIPNHKPAGAPNSAGGQFDTRRNPAPKALLQSDITSVPSEISTQQEQGSRILAGDQSEHRFVDINHFSEDEFLEIWNEAKKKFDAVGIVRTRRDFFRELETEMDDEFEALGIDTNLLDRDSIQNIADLAFDSYKQRHGWSAGTREWEDYHSSLREAIGTYIEPQRVKTTFEGSKIELNDIGKQPSGIGYLTHSELQQVRSDLLALSDSGTQGYCDTLVETIAEGQLSRGVSGAQGTAAVRAWADSSAECAESIKAHESDRAAQFRQGVMATTVFLAGNQDGSRESKEKMSNYGMSIEEPTSEEFEQALERLQKNSVREDDLLRWTDLLSLQESNYTWRGALVAAAALSHTDEWWGFRENVSRTIYGEIVG
ncbi:hypothetical protein [Lysinibacter cavernae]|uniref:hypothetical protein n=1 Tax=Lysinibacter cavernae TaxID=1640652 RepID=UPI00361816FE